MPGNRINNLCILAFICSVFFFFSIYGKYMRTFVSPGRVVSMPSTADIYNLYRSTGVKGRILIIYSRNLILGEHEYVSAETKAIELAVQHGIVRKINYVIPDSSWPGVKYNLSLVSNYWPTPSGYAGAFEDWRVNVDPLSRFVSPEEEALVIIEPGAWTKEEYEQISKNIKSGLPLTDLLAILRGSSSEIDLFTNL